MHGNILRDPWRKEAAIGIDITLVAVYQPLVGEARRQWRSLLACHRHGSVFVDNGGVRVHVVSFTDSNVVCDLLLNICWNSSDHGLIGHAVGALAELLANAHGVHCDAIATRSVVVCLSRQRTEHDDEPDRGNDDNENKDECEPPE